MATIKNAVYNGLGKMGITALQRVLKESDIRVIGAIDPTPSDFARELMSTYDIKLITDFSILDDITDDLPKKILVDFSTPKACSEIMKHIAQRGGWKAVIGTTPLKEYEKEIFSLSEKIPMMPSSNFSPEVNKFFKQMVYVSRMSDPKSSVSVHEIHRAEKASTAGTAITIAKTLCEGMNKKGYILLRESKAFDSRGTPLIMPEMKPNVLKDYIQVSSERFGDEPGTHIVRIGNENDYMEYKVRATRGSYGDGSVKAINFMGDVTEPGLYSFSKNVLGL